MINFVFSEQTCLLEVFVKKRSFLNKQFENCQTVLFHRATVRTRKLFNRKTTLNQYLNVFNVVTKKECLLVT